MKIVIASKVLEEITSMYGTKAGKKLLEIANEKVSIFSLQTEEIEITIEDFKLSKSEEKQAQYLREAIEAIEHLNQRANKRFSAEKMSNVGLVTRLFKEGRSLDEIKAVIDAKCVDWLGGSMEAYLRPITLFGPKFESYLMEAQTILSEQKLSKKLENIFGH